MDEDLKIVILAELDENESAQRIEKQLPNIAKLINSKSSIKVGVTLDDSNIQSQTQNITKQFKQAVKKSAVTMDIDIGADKVNEMVSRLKELKVPNSLIDSFVKGIENANVKVLNISTSFEDVSKTVSATISGLNEAGEVITRVQRAKLITDEDGKVTAQMLQDLSAVSENYEKLEQQQKRLSAQQKKDNETRVSSLVNLETKLNRVKSVYSDINAPGAIKNQDSLDSLNGKYQEIWDTISRLKEMNGKLSPIDKAEIQREISNLEDLVKAYRNFESAGTKLRKKDVEAIKVDQNAGLDKLEAQLKNAGILTEEFQARIGELKEALSRVSDSGGIRSFLNGFDALKADAGVLQEKIRGVNETYKELSGVERRITDIQKEINGLDSNKDAEKLKLKREELANALKSKEILDQEIASYGELAQYAKQAAEAEKARIENEYSLRESQAKIADEAREAEEYMARMPSRMVDLHSQMSRLISPSETLAANMAELENLISRYNGLANSAGTGDSFESEKSRVELWRQIKDLVSGCKNEMSDLGRVQRRDLQDFKFTENLEKAKADIATIGRQWSALFSDKELETSFRQLQTKLKDINNQADLSKWTAEFNRFKSEVRAAGKNAQSFFDVLKNNVSKVAQWGLATFSIYDVMKRLKSAVDIVIELDTAMVDLRKTTDETESTYKSFSTTANSTAKNLGVTTASVISQTAEWSRLGYTMQEAAKMAENSAIFTAISPELTMDESTDGLISIMKAFGYEADEVLDGVISKINKLGNELAVSNKDIVEVMTRASSAMQAANNSFEQTAALATAAIEITRNSEQAGNALRTLSMRIRGYDEETEEYSEDIAVLTGKIADLTKAESNHNAGVSLFEVGNPDQYRSTYDILSDIAGIWDDLTDKNQAQLLEVLFGKQRAQVGAAILSNFESAESAIIKMQNAAGNAMAEMEKVYDSLEYKLNHLQETWVGVSQSLLDDSALKASVDGVNALSDAAAGLIKWLGPLGTLGLGTFGVGLKNLITSAGRPEIEGSQIVPAYALVATRNELAA